MKCLFGLFAAFAVLILVPGVRAADNEVGVVLLHGKWGEPSRLAVLAQTLKDKGYRVVTPVMPWAGSRMYDADYPAALAEIDAAVKSLRESGAKRIIVGGTSFGANASIAYAASGRQVDGVMALAPGHNPDSTPRFAPSVSKAGEAIAAGKGDEKASFEDNNQGQWKTIRTTSKIYLSYFDPNGLGAMPKSAAAIPKPVPFLMVIGKLDRNFERGQAYIFNDVPKHPANTYLVVGGDHFDTSKTAAPQIAEWIASLGY